MLFRKAEERDVPAIAGIYEEIHTREEKGESTCGWIRSIYPTRDTVLQGLARGDMFVAEEDGRVIASAVINRIQGEMYFGAPWEHAAGNDGVMVLHTLAVSPGEAGRGVGSAFVAFYEKYAKDHGCPYLRMDTNARNLRARRLYAHLGYREAAVVPCVFNGIEGVQLVLLEKKL